MFVEFDAFGIGANPFSSSHDKKRFSLTVLDRLTGRVERWGNLTISSTGARFASTVVNDRATGSNLVKLDVTGIDNQGSQATGTVYKVGTSLTPGTFSAEIKLLLAVAVLAADGTLSVPASVTGLPVTVFANGIPSRRQASALDSRSVHNIEMKSTFALLASIVAHALLIGLLMGMSRSPVVGVVLPLLLGLGGYRLLDALLGVTPKEAKAAIPWTSALGWMIALWCVVVVVAVFTGIALRSGAIQLGRPRVTTLSLINLDRQPIQRIPDLALIAAYYDRIEMNADQRRTVARALSDSSLEAKPILSSLQELFANGHGIPPAVPSGYEIFQFHREVGR